MGFFDAFLDTASKAFSWLDNNKAALDLISGAAKGVGAYMTYKQQADAQKFQQKQYEDYQRRLDENSQAPSEYDKSIPLSEFNATKMLSGSMADAMKYRGQ